MSTTARLVKRIITSRNSFDFEAFGSLQIERYLDY
jgi:hypothetical protein